MLVEQLIKELVDSSGTEYGIEMEYAVPYSKTFISVRAIEYVLEQALQKLISDNSPIETAKSENPVVRRDSLGAESIGRKYRVMSGGNSLSPNGSEVIGVHGNNEDGSVFSLLDSNSGYFMDPDVLLQEITESTESTAPTATPVKDLPDTVTFTDVVHPKDNIEAVVEQGRFWITVKENSLYQTGIISPQDAKSLAEFLDIKADELLAEGDNN